MTEAEWQACTDAREMIDADDDEVVHATRKWWLFLIAVVRRLRPQFLEPLRGALDVASRFVDGEATETEVNDAWLALSPPEAALGVLRDSLVFFTGTYNHPEHILESLAAGGSGLAPEEEFAAQADLAREVFGNPYRPVRFLPEWRTDAAMSLAHTIYESRDFSDMPVLGDALQDAGCTSAEVLDHCRCSGPHAHGCWVVDSVLDKSWE